jgi:Trk K+ transport system NAD-binding subunit
MQPWVASVQCAILQKAPGSVQFYLREFESMEGLQYEEVRRRFSGAVVCGMVRSKSFIPRLNPAADEILEKGDRIIALAPNGALSHSEFRPKVLLSRLLAPHPPTHLPTHHPP